MAESRAFSWRQHPETLATPMRSCLAAGRATRLRLVFICAIRAIRGQTLFVWHRLRDAVFYGTATGDVAAAAAQSPANHFDPCRGHGAGESMGAARSHRQNEQPSTHDLSSVKR